VGREPPLQRIGHKRIESPGIPANVSRGEHGDRSKAIGRFIEKFDVTTNAAETDGAVIRPNDLQGPSQICEHLLVATFKDRFPKGPITTHPAFDDAKGAGARHHGIERLLGGFHRVLDRADKLLNRASFRALADPIPEAGYPRPFPGPFASHCLEINPSIPRRPPITAVKSRRVLVPMAIRPAVKSASFFLLAIALGSLARHGNSRIAVRLFAD
jgi:hypothetical protein